VGSSSKPAAKHSLKRIFKTRLGLAALVFIVLAATGSVFIYALNSTASPSPVSILTPAAEPAAVDFGNLIALNGKYVDFNYPAAFNQVSVDPPGGNVLETYVFSKPPSPYWYLTVEVYSLPTGKLTDSPQYAYCLARPSQFTQETLESRGRSMVVMSDHTSPFSKTAFVVRGTQLATVTLTGGIKDSDQLQRTLQLVLDSFIWMQS